MYQILYRKQETLWRGRGQLFFPGDGCRRSEDRSGRPVDGQNERGERAVDGTGDSVERIRADHQADTLPEVSLDELAAWGVTGIVVDLDNTVCAYHRPELAPGVAAWVEGARKRGFALVLVSNNFSERVASIGAQLGIPVVANALKPLPFAFLRALRLLGTPRRATVVIGDQLFTDVLGAKLLGLRTILTKPLVSNDFPLTRVLRFLERTIAGRT
jgi:HAD superfamily phosphatase (TIGR01668 family)